MNNAIAATAMRMLTGPGQARIHINGVPSKEAYYANTKYRHGPDQPHVYGHDTA